MFIMKVHIKWVMFGNMYLVYSSVILIIGKCVYVPS